MDEIFLQDYANNVAQAKDPFGIAALEAQPGFENYQPSFANQELQPMGLVDDTPSICIDVTAAPLIEDNKILLSELPNVKP